nr:hypothetical protein [uncultured Carboxylicivirga sp.]
MDPKPTFQFPIAELILRGDKLLYYLKRDSTQFKNYGVKDTTTERISNLCNSLEQFYSEDQYDEIIHDATVNVNCIRNELFAILNSFQNSIRLIYGTKSIEFRLFKFRCLHNITDCNLSEYAQYVVKIATPRLPTLKIRHITKDTLDKICNLSNDLSDAKNYYSQVTNERNEKQTEQVRTANELHSTLISLCEIGKNIWIEKNNAYYTEYVINSSKKPILSTEEQLN